MKPEYQLTADEVVHALETDAAEGLTSEDARRRLARYGLNQLRTERLYRKFKQPFFLTEIYSAEPPSVSIVKS